MRRVVVVGCVECALGLSRAGCGYVWWPRGVGDGGMVVSEWLRGGVGARGGAEDDVRVRAEVASGAVALDEIEAIPRGTPVVGS